MLVSLNRNLILSGICLIQILTALPCFAFQLVPEQEPQVEPSYEQRQLELAQTLFSDRRTALTALSFRKQIEVGNNSQAVSELARLQTSDPQILVPMANGTWGPVFLNVLNDFQLLPQREQQRLIQQYAGSARRDLEGILGEQELERLPTFWLRYPGTEESFNALLLMSRLQLDRGNRRSARFWLELVANSKNQRYSEMARPLLQQLATDDRPMPNSNPEATSARESDGNVSRPKHVKWGFRPVISPVLEQQMRLFRQAAFEERYSVTASWSAAVTNNGLFQRTMRGVARINPANSETEWHFPIVPVLDQDLLKNSVHLQTFGNVTPNLPTSTSFARLDQSALANLFCRDEVHTQIVADQGRVFVVAADHDADVQGDNGRRFFNGFSGGLGKFRPGQLIALDQESGRRLWTVGYASLAQHLATTDQQRRTKAVWFFGPPQIAGQWVFAVLEWSGEIRLAKFSLSTGQYVNSVPISVPEQTIDKDQIRTFWASTPVRKEGHLWMTTTTGWLVCVDESTLSVLWASRLAEASKLRTTNNLGRGRAAARTSAASLRSRWNRSLLHLAGDRMLVLSQEDYSAILVASDTGKKLKSIPVAASRWVHADEENLLLATDSVLQCYRLTDGEERWKKSLSPPGQASEPSGTLQVTGKGVRRGNVVLMPLNDGHLGSVDLTSGQFTRHTDRLLPPAGWGHLSESQDDDLLYVAPDQILRLSTEPPQLPQREHLQPALDLLAAGGIQEALQEARQVTQNDTDYEAAQKLIFDCLIQLAQKAPEDHLAELRDSASSEYQNALLAVLEIHFAHERGQFAEALQQTCQLLNQSVSVLNRRLTAGFPDDDVLMKIRSSQSQEAVRVRRTIRAWAIDSLLDSLNQLPPDEWPIDQIATIRDRFWAGVECEQLRNLFLQKASVADSNELTFRLLVQSVHLAADSADSDFDLEIQVLDGLLEKLLSDEARQTTAPKEFLQQVLGTALAELPKSFVERLEQDGLFQKWNLSRPETLIQQRTARQNAVFNEWNTTDWTVVPVRFRHSYSYRRSVKGRLDLLHHGDPLLANYQWKMGHEPNAQLSVDSDAGRPVWRITLPQQMSRNHVTTDRISRFGTILLLDTRDRLTAVSILDQRMLWSVAIPSQVYSEETAFADFSIRSVSKPYLARPPGRRLLFVESNRIAVQNANNIEVRDLLSGEVLWDCPCPAVQVPAVGGVNGTVLVCSEDGKCFEIYGGSGRVRKSPLPRVEQWQVMATTESEIVRWRPQPPENPNLKDAVPSGPAVEWKDPASGTVQHEISLEGYRQFQFLDSQTLVAISPDGKMKTVNLLNRETQDYSVPFAADRFPGKPYGRFVAANENYLYVGFFPSDRNLLRQSPTFRHLKFQDELFVIDRKTGKNAGIVTADGPALLLSNPDFPVLVIGSLKDPKSTKGPLRIQGWDRSGNRQLFQERFPISYGIRDVSFELREGVSFETMIDGGSYLIKAVDAETAEE